MAYCDQHSGFAEQLKTISKKQDEMHLDIKTLVDPKNGIYHRVAKLEFVKRALAWIAALVFGGGGIMVFVRLVIW